MSLPVPPRLDRWPVAVQHAMRLRGAIVRCGPGFRGLAWPDDPRVRLTALGALLDAPQRCAAGLTAAWVWGAADRPGMPLCIAHPAGAQRHVPHRRDVRWYGARFAPGDVETIGGLRVTSPWRTLLDLLHDEQRYGAAEASACRELVAMLALPEDEMRARLAARRRPRRRLANTRLSAVLMGQTTKE